MYSQRDEEKYILNFFGNYVGRFLDIGAYNGKTFSNTHQLVLNNWAGVCIEPSPSVYKSLVDLYKSNKKIQTIQKGVGLNSGIFTFYDFGGDAVSSFDKKHANKWENANKNKSKELEIEVIAINDLFLDIDYNFDFINIDTEGWSFRILRSLPFHKLVNTKMLCIEFDSYLNDILDIVYKYGFKEYHQTAENILVIKK